MRPTSILARIMLLLGLLYMPLSAGGAPKPASPIPERQTGADWIIENLPISGTWYDLALSPDGYARVLITPNFNHPIYQEQTEGGWNQQILSDLPSSTYAIGSIVVDPGGFARGVYACQDAPGDNTSCYITQDHVGWNNQFAGGHGASGDLYSLALDSLGNPHFSYNTTISYTLPMFSINYAHLTAGGWVTDTVDSQADVGRENKIGLDQEDRPHITYLQQGNDQYLNYAFWDGANWQITNLTPDGGGSGNDLVLDSQDHPHISRHWGGTIYYTFSDGASWHSQEVDNGFSAGLYTSIDLGPGEQPVISYILDGDLRLAHLDSGAWITETVETAWLDTYTPLILQVDEFGQAHILYSLQYSGLRYAYQRIYLPIEDLTATVNGMALIRKPTRFSASVGAGNYVTYEWDFGDGSIGEGKNVSHTYMDSGEYEVVVDAHNSVSSGIYTFTVNVLPYTDIYLPMITEDDVKAVYTFSGLCASYDPRAQDIEARINWCVPKVWLRSTGEMQVFTTWTLEILSGPTYECLIKHGDNSNTNMYLTDDSGGRYDHTETGDAAHGDTYICNGETITGWFLFPPTAPGETQFTFHDDDQGVQIEDIVVGQ